VVFSRCAKWRGFSAPVAAEQARRGEGKRALRECKKLHEIACKAGLRSRELQFFDIGKSEQFRARMRSLLRRSQKETSEIVLKEAFAARHQNPEN
jgi:hypothetical protein